MSEQTSKQASEPKPVTKLTGRLVGSASGWVLLEVPNAFVRGLFAALDVPGAELPPSKSSGKLNAHISVMRAEEVRQLGGLEKINELGKHFTYQLGELHEVNPGGWEEMEKAWLVRVKSPALEKLRKSYGLPPEPVVNDQVYKFHITVAVRRKGVLRKNDMSKAAWEWSDLSMRNYGKQFDKVNPVSWGYQWLTGSPHGLSEEYGMKLDEYYNPLAENFNQETRPGTWDGAIRDTARLSTATGLSSLAGVGAGAAAGGSGLLSAGAGIVADAGTYAGLDKAWDINIPGTGGNKAVQTPQQPQAQAPNSNPPTQPTQSSQVGGIRPLPSWMSTANWLGARKAFRRMQ